MVAGISGTCTRLSPLANAMDLSSRMSARPSLYTVRSTDLRSLARRGAKAGWARGDSAADPAPTAPKKVEAMSAAANQGFCGWDIGTAFQDARGMREEAPIN